MPAKISERIVNALFNAKLRKQATIILRKQVLNKLFMACYLRFK
jgi:hypothetical protein